MRCVWIILEITVLFGYIPGCGYFWIAKCRNFWYLECVFCLFLIAVPRRGWAEMVFCFGEKVPYKLCQFFRTVLFFYCCHINSITVRTHTVWWRWTRKTQVTSYIYVCFLINENIKFHYNFTINFLHQKNVNCLWGLPPQLKSFR